MLKLGFNVHLEAHPNKINLIVDGRPFIVEVDDPYFYDLLSMSILRSTIVMRHLNQAQKIDGSIRSCLFFATFGERTNCQKSFASKRSDARFCSAACRDHYNKKLIRAKKNPPKK
jgi:hypothetical protein